MRKYATEQEENRAFDIFIDKVDRIVMKVAKWLGIFGGLYFLAHIVYAFVSN